MKKKKFNIINTFDIFSTEAISIIKDKIIKFVLIEADNFFIPKSKDNKNNKKKILVPVINNLDDIEYSTSIENIDDNTVYFSVLNNRKLYNFMTNSWERYNNKAQNENIKC